MNGKNAQARVLAKRKDKLSKPVLAIGVVLVALLLAFAYLILKEENETQNPTAQNNLQNETEAENLQEVVSEDSEVFNSETDYIETVKNLDQAVATVTGANLITPDNKVVNDRGQVVQNNALPMTPEAPKLSAPLASEEIPGSSIKIKADANGFSPAEFTVSKNQPVTLVLSSVGVGSRLVFNNSSLIALELPVPAGYTMAKIFNAPSVSGVYTFYQDMPDRSHHVGKMIVK